MRRFWGWGEGVATRVWFVPKIAPGVLGFLSGREILDGLDGEDESRVDVIGWGVRYEMRDGENWLAMLSKIEEEKWILKFVDIVVRSKWSHWKNLRRKQ
jgi:hypothetical protein